MEPQPSTSAGTSKGTSTRQTPTDDGVDQAAASTSGDGGAVQVQQQQQQGEKLFFNGRASMEQCKQLFSATCRIKLHRIQEPSPAAQNHATIETPDSGSSSSDEDEEFNALPEEYEQVFPPLPAPTPAPEETTELRSVTKKVTEPAAAGTSSSRDVKREPGHVEERKGPRVTSQELVDLEPVPEVKKESKSGGSSSEDEESNVIPASSGRRADLSTVKVKEESDTSGSSSSEEDLAVRSTSSAGPSTKKVAVTNRKSPTHCRVCGKTICSKWYLKIHMRKHTGDKRFKCEHCGRSFWNSTALALHNKARDERNGICPKEMSGGWRPKGAWQCQICNKILKSATYYLNHKRMHRGDKPFKCGECGKAFVESSTLAKHRKIHSDVWQYSCVFCDKGFHYQHIYWSHLRVHTEEKPYFCKVKGCRASFRQHHSLKMHLRTIH